MRRWWSRVLAAAVVAAPVLVAVPAAASADPYCGIRWGSLPKSVSHSPVTGDTRVSGVRAGRHTCYDRMVVDLTGPYPSAQVRYVDGVETDGAGIPVPLRGGAKLRIFVDAPAYDDAGHPTYDPAQESELVDVTGYATFRQLAWAGSFEGRSTIGLGVRARLPFRVFVLDGPGSGSRVVVDVAHRW